MRTVLPFTAHCAHGHDRIDFTDRELFTEHMTGEHRQTKLLPGGAHWDSTLDHPRYYKADPAAPGWAQGGILEPHPHKAPRRTAGGLAKVAERIAAGDYTWPGPRWKGDTPAAEVMAS